MPDQADSLRLLVSRLNQRGGLQAGPLRVRGRARVVAVTGGKGGVGKSSLAANLALALAHAGRRVLLVDADLGMASTDVLLGLAPERTLAEVALDGAGLRGAIVPLRPGLDFLPGAAGIAEMADLPPVARAALIDGLSGIEDDYDLVLVDTAAGAGENVREFLRAADHVLLVATVDPTAITDAYALAKMLVREGQSRLGLVVNMVRSEREGEALFQRFAAVARRFADAEVAYLGSVPFDWKAAAAVRQRRPLLVGAPFAPASIAVRRLAAELLRWARPAGPEAAEEARGEPGRAGLFGLLRRAVGM